MRATTVTIILDIQSEEVADSLLPEFFSAHAIPFHVAHFLHFKQKLKESIIVYNASFFNYIELRVFRQFLSSFKGFLVY